MKNYIIGLMVFAMFTISCAGDKKNLLQLDKTESADLIQTGTEAYDLINTQCYICHSPVSSSHDEIIAPPMAAVKMRYSRLYQDEREFVEAIVSWTMNPVEDKSVMKGAVNKFNIMPKQPFKETDIRDIATYIYQNELEEPQWFEQHSMEMHGKGRRGRAYKQGRNPG